MYDFLEKISLLTISAIISYLFGEITGLFIFLCVAMFFDYATGILKALYKKELSSKIGFKGILKKVSILLIVSTVHLLEVNLLTTGTYCRDTIVIFYIGNECISLLENIVGFGVPVPNWLKETLNEIKKKGE